MFVLTLFMAILSVEVDDYEFAGAQTQGQGNISIVKNTNHSKRY